MTRTLDTILGRAFASMGAAQQAEVLNAAGLFAQRTYDTSTTQAKIDLDMQACAIADDLDAHGWALVLAIAQFAKDSTR